MSAVAAQSSLASSLVSDVTMIRRQFPIFATRKLHCLDSAATAQMPMAVSKAIESFDLEMRANVYGGVYGLACEALAAYEESRHAIARYLGANAASEVVFTYGTTSAINLVAASFGERLVAGDEIVISALEHHSNTLPWRALARRRGVNLKVLPGLVRWTAGPLRERRGHRRVHRGLGGTYESNQLKGRR